MEKIKNIKNISFKNITFKKFIISYSIVLAVLMLCFLGYVANSLIKYENNQLDNYMENFIGDLKEANSGIQINGLSEIKKGAFDKADASALKGIAYVLANDSITYQQTMDSKDDSPVFDIMDSEGPLLRVTLAKKETLKRLSLLSFNVWEVKDVQLLKKDGIFNCEISAPVDCKVEVNGKALTEKEYADTAIYVGLAELAKKTDLVYPVKYVVKGLTDAPEVKITGKDGKSKEVKGKGTKFAVESPCVKVADLAAAKSKLVDCPDVQELFRTWSLYMTNDLHGVNHGFGTIKENLIEGTYLYKYAWNWATGPDIGLTSKHGLANPMFSDEKVCNFNIYSKTEFSCDAYLQKNMIVHAKPHPDKMSEHLHFVYYDSTDDGVDNPSWKIVGMMAITK